jgi:hypothetical protein
MTCFLFSGGQTLSLIHTQLHQQVAHHSSTQAVQSYCLVCQRLDESGQDFLRTIFSSRRNQETRKKPEMHYLLWRKLQMLPIQTRRRSRSLHKSTPSKKSERPHLNKQSWAWWPALVIEAVREAYEGG